jgi:hypothetical protein
MMTSVTLTVGHETAGRWQRIRGAARSMPTPAVVVNTQSMRRRGTAAREGGESAYESVTGVIERAQ